MTRNRPIHLLLLGSLFSCTDEPPPTASTDAAFAVTAETCAGRSNNNLRKLTECVTLDAVRAHQAAFQQIADDNNGIRTSGTPGYDASVDYVADKLMAAGYDVTLQTFSFNQYIVNASSLEQTAPAVRTYFRFIDYQVLEYSPSRNVTGSVTAVDLQLGLGNTSTSGCEAADFTGFTPGHIALVQRGTCTFQVKAENAAAAGAVAVILFNQGNTGGIDRQGVFSGTLGTSYIRAIPVFSTSYDQGVEWSATTGLELSLELNAFDGMATTANVIAENGFGRADRVVIAGGHLDSVDRGPGINDNGSGAAALLEAALQLARVESRQRIRFIWFSAEEYGLLGSRHYVANLPAAELDHIRLFLNFHMVGSPNYVRFVYDGDGSDGGLVGPDGSGGIESTIGRLYSERGLAYEGEPVGVSSEASFMAAGVPIGGITTGRDGIKTAQQASIYGGVAGVAFDPCYHQACDTFANVNLDVLDLNADIVASTILTFGMTTESVDGTRGKGNFRMPAPVSSLATF